MMGRETERPLSPTGSVWFPGKTVYPVTARAQEIAKRRDELIGLLNGVPESDFELSLTDLVEKRSDPEGLGLGSGSGSVKDDEKKRIDDGSDKILKPRKRNMNANPNANLTGNAHGNVNSNSNRSRNRNCNGNGNGNGNGGVLLKVFMPVSFTRTLTRSASSVSVRTPLDSRNREGEESQSQPSCCWSLSWERGRWAGKSRRHSAKFN